MSLSGSMQFLVFGFDLCLMMIDLPILSRNSGIEHFVNAMLFCFSCIPF